MNGTEFYIFFLRRRDGRNATYESQWMIDKKKRQKNGGKRKEKEAPGGITIPRVQTNKVLVGLRKRQDDFVLSFRRAETVL
jgi:hypothetical protein